MKLPLATSSISPCQGPQLAPSTGRTVLPGEKVGLANSVDRRPYKPAVVAAPIDAGLGAVSRPGAFARIVDRAGGVAGEEHGDRRQSHNRAVSGAPLVRRAGVWLSAQLELLERRPRRIADVEAITGAAPEAVTVPAGVSLDLVVGIEPLTPNEAVCQTKRQRGVVGPLARGEAMRSAARHVRDRLERPRPLELQRRAERVPYRQPNKRAPKPVPVQIRQFNPSGHRPTRRRSIATAPVRSPPVLNLK